MPDEFEVIHCLFPLTYCQSPLLHTGNRRSYFTYCLSPPIILSIPPYILSRLRRGDRQGETDCGRAQLKICDTLFKSNLETLKKQVDCIETDNRFLRNKFNECLPCVGQG